VVFLSPSKQILRQRLISGHDCFFPHKFQFLILDHAVGQRNNLGVTVVKYTKKTQTA
jgi:hypothetical protein